MLRAARFTLSILLLAAGALAISDCASWYTKGAVHESDPGGLIVDTYNITIVPGSPYTWADILADQVKVINTSHPYLNCTLGVPATDSDPAAVFNCTLKRQGDATRRGPYPSYKIKLAPGLKWRKQDTFKFKKEPTDFSKVRSKIVGDLLMHTPNHVSYLDSFARMYMTRSGVNYDMGFFTVVEETDDKFLSNRKLPSGSLYKIVNGFNFATADLTYIMPSTNPAFNEALFDNVLSPVVPVNDNNTRIVNTIHAVLSANASTYQSLLNTHFDVPNLATFVGVEVLSGNVMNTLARNYLIYAPDTKDGSGRWSLWGWDFDKGMAYFEQPDVIQVIPIPPTVEDGIGSLWANPVLYALFMTPEYVAVMNKTVTDMHNTVWNNAYVSNLTAVMTPIVHDEIFTSTDITGFTYGWGTTAQRANVIESVMAQIANVWDANYGYFLRSIWQPRPPTLWVGGFNSDSSTHLVTYSPFAHMLGCEINVEVYIYARAQDAAAMAGTEFARPEYPLPANASAGAQPAIVSATGLTTNGYNGVNGQVEVVMADFYKPNTQYFVRLISRAVGNDQGQFISQQGVQYNDPITKLSFKQLNYFTSPASFGAAPAFVAPTPQPTAAIDGYMYALLDGSASTATGSSCISTVFTLPSGWFLAPNDATTIGHVTSLAQTWGTSSLVLRDGTSISRVNGAVNGGRALRIVIRKQGIGYAASTCTSRVLLVSANRPVTPACPKYADVQMYAQYLETHDYFADAAPDPNAASGCKVKNTTDSGNSTNSSGSNDSSTGAATGGAGTGAAGTTTGGAANCPALTAPTNGAVDVTTEPGVALYSCTPGYTLIGARSRVCMSGSGWAGSAPTCLQNVGCTAPAAPEHGSASVTGAQATGDILTFTCDAGFTLSGSATLVCGPTGSYDQAVPTCVPGGSTAPNDSVKSTVTVASGTLMNATPSLILATIIVGVITWAVRVY